MTDEERFMQLVEFELNSGCWLWLGSTTGAYGSFRTGYAHRAAFEMFVGPLEEGQVVCHRCDTPLCVRPDHLFAGTQSDNIRDAINKGRFFPPRLHGEDHGNAKLNNDAVRSIRRDHRTAAAIARDYGVAASLITAIKAGRIWAHVPIEDGVGRPWDRRFGAVLRALRRAARLSPAQLARAVRMTPEALIACERGSRPLYVTEFVAYATAFEIEPDDYSSLFWAADNGSAVWRQYV